MFIKLTNEDDEKIYVAIDKLTSIEAQDLELLTRVNYLNGYVKVKESFEEIFNEIGYAENQYEIIVEELRNISNILSKLK